MSIKCIVATLLLSCLANAQQVASGFVFEDKNGNNIKDKNEKGIANIKVSNGNDVVSTDSRGFYKLPLKEDSFVFVIKPSGYQVSINKNMLPQFYYGYRPKGSPMGAKYPGKLPIGKISTNVNFSLTKRAEDNNFQILVFGDPQVKSKREVGYFHRGIVNDVIKNKGNSVFGISLGDLVYNTLEMYPDYIDVVKEIGLPWYNLSGNHDINFEATEDKYANETFQKYFGPTNYSFNYGNVHFLILDNVLYPYQGKPKAYTGGFREDELNFIKNDLKTVDKDKLVVVASHIHFKKGGEDDFHFQDKDRQVLFEALKPFSNVLLLSGHRHTQSQYYFSKNDGWEGSGTLHEYNVGTTSGDLYTGTADELGVPSSTMADGTYRGYSIINFSGNQYKIKYKIPGKSTDFQINLYVPKVISKEWSTARFYANVFLGGSKDKVEYRVDNGEWKPMIYTESIDPNYAEYVYKWDTSDHLLTGKRPSNPAVSGHLWYISCPELEVGKHILEVRANNIFGENYFSSKEFIVEDSNPIP